MRHSHPHTLSAFIVGCALIAGAVLVFAVTLPVFGFTVVEPGGTVVDSSGGGDAAVILGGNVPPGSGGTPGVTPGSVTPGSGKPGGNPGNQIGGGTEPTVTTLLGRARGVLDALIPFIIGLAIFVILWGIFTYITKAADEEKRAEAKRFIIYGLLGVFFMISIWGFVTILINTFSVEQRIQSGDIPTVPEIVPAVQ